MDPWEMTLAFGVELRTERESRGAALESVAEATKVPAQHLLALEQDRFDDLPGGVFTKGIVRSYCQFLSLDAEPWLERLPATSTDETSQHWSEFAENVQRNRIHNGPRMGLRWWGVLLMLLALAGFSWAAWRYVVRPRLSLSSAKPALEQVACPVCGAATAAIVQISTLSAHFA